MWIESVNIVSQLPPLSSKTKTPPPNPNLFFFCHITSKNPTKYYWSITPNLKMCIIFCCCKDQIYSIQIMKRCNINCTKLYNMVFIFKLIPNSAVNHVFYLIYLLTIYMYILHEHVFFFKSFFFCLLVLDVIILYGISFLFYWIFASLLSSAVFSKTFVLSCLLTIGKPRFFKLLLYII